MMSQREKFIKLFGPTFLAVVILLMLDHYRQYAIVPVVLFWIIFFAWDSYDKKKKEKKDAK